MHHITRRQRAQKLLIVIKEATHSIKPSMWRVLCETKNSPTHLGGSCHPKGMVGRMEWGHYSGMIIHVHLDVKPQIKQTNETYFL